MSSEKQKYHSMTFQELIRPGDQPFPIPKLPKNLFKDVNLVMICLNCYVFFIKSSHQYSISVLVYIYGMLFLGNKSPAVKQYIKTRNMYPIYIYNFFLWYCQLKKYQIPKLIQVYAISLILAIYFLKFLLMFVYVSYKSIFMKRPTFRQTYVASQLVSLRNIIPSTLVQLTGIKQFQIFIYTSIIISCIQNWRLGQQRHLISLFRLICQLYSFFVPKYRATWIVLNIFIMISDLIVDFFYTWDLKRIKQGCRAYPIWIYIFTWIINIVGRCFWIQQLHLGHSLYCRDSISMYHKIFWNLIRVDKNYSKNILKEVKGGKKMKIKFITGKDNTLCFADQILQQTFEKFGKNISLSVMQKSQDKKNQ